MSSRAYQPPEDCTLQMLLRKFIRHDGLYVQEEIKASNGNEICTSHIPLLDSYNANLQLSKNSSIALDFNRRSACLGSFDSSNLPTTFPSCAFQHLCKCKLRHVQPQLRANKVGDTVPIRNRNQLCRLHHKEIRKCKMLQFDHGHGAPFDDGWMRRNCMGKTGFGIFR